MPDRFSDRAAHGLCVPEGQLVSSGRTNKHLCYTRVGGVHIGLSVQLAPDNLMEGNQTTVDHSNPFCYCLKTAFK